MLVNTQCNEMFTSFTGGSYCNGISRNSYVPIEVQYKTNK